MKARLEQVPEMEDITRKLKRLREENDQLRNRMTTYLTAGATTMSPTNNEEREAATSRQPQIRSPVIANHLYLPDRPNGSGRTPSTNPIMPDYTDFSKYNGTTDYTSSGVRQHFRSNNIGKRTKSADNIRVSSIYGDLDYNNESDYGVGSYDHNNRNSRYSNNHRTTYDERRSTSNTTPEIDDIMRKYKEGRLSADAVPKEPTLAAKHRRSHSSGGNYGKKDFFLEYVPKFAFSDLIRPSKTQDTQKNVNFNYIFCFE